jgi:hypothetical protein
MVTQYIEDKAIEQTAETEDPAIVIAHSISSTVELDYRAGTAHKTYEPPTWVRVLYGAAFQSKFPYSTNEDALEAGRLRRHIAGILTTYWFGVNLISPVLDVRREADGKMAFVTQLVEGDAPKDRRHARRFLRQLTTHFLQAGLPTWQVTPHNPRAIGNLIAAQDGVYRVIDLESNLVAPLMPVSGVIGAIRQGNFPAFDDIDVDRLNGYLAKHEHAITEALGRDRYDDLVASAAAYAAAAGRWHGSERRIISRSLRFALKLVDVPSWVRALKRTTNDSQKMADRLVSQGIEDWSAEGHLTPEQATNLRKASETPAVASALTHLGAHIAMTVPLRFPLGSIARFGWTIAMRASAEAKALLRKGSAKSARQEHTLLVATASLVPTFGAAAYMLAKPLRSNRALAMIAFDRMFRKMPAKLYGRLHMAPFMVYHAKLDAPERTRPSLKSLVAAVRARIAGLHSQRTPIAMVVVPNAAIVIAGGIMYFGYGSRSIFNERGLMNTADALQLLVAGTAGIAAYVMFWKRGATASIAEQAGSMFWAISGAGLLFFAADDYFGLHERMGDWLAAHGHLVPLYTNSVDDVITMSFGATALMVLYVFRNELVADRQSSTLLCLGAASSAMMVAVDVYGFGPIRPLEFPAQVLGVGFFMLAYVTRLREVAGPAREREYVVAGAGTQEASPVTVTA